MLHGSIHRCVTGAYRLFFCFCCFIYRVHYIIIIFSGVYYTVLLKMSHTRWILLRYPYYVCVFSCLVHFYNTYYSCYLFVCSFVWFFFGKLTVIQLFIINIIHTIVICLRPYTLPRHFANNTVYKNILIKSDRKQCE